MKSLTFRHIVKILDWAEKEIAEYDTLRKRRDEISTEFSTENTESSMDAKIKDAIEIKELIRSHLDGLTFSLDMNKDTTTSIKSFTGEE